MRWRLRAGVRIFCLASAVLGSSVAARAQLVDGFDPGANGVIYAMAVQPDGKIIVGGQFSLLGGGGTGVFPLNRIARLNPDGSVDGSFNPVVTGSAVVSLAVQTDGKILVGGVFTMLAGVPRSNIARLNPDGSLDTSFNPGTGGGGAFGAEVDVIAVQPDGKIIVGGEFTQLGGITRNRIGRLNANGSVDTAFNPNANDAVISLAVQPDGKIVVGGVFTTMGGATRNRIARLNSTGSLDTAFNPGANGNVITAVALQADGKILLGGDFTGLGGVTGTTPRSKIGRLNTDGTVDAGFNPGATGSIVYTIGVQADGKILAGGNFTGLGNGGATPRRFIGRLGPDGSPDDSFDPGASATVYGVLVQPDGSVLVGGTFGGLGGGTGTTPRSRIGRVTNTDAAIQTLTLTGVTGVRWMRSGAAPEVSRVTFDWSLDGVTYVPLGTGTRMAGGWQLGGLSLPARDLYIRARGFYVSGYENAAGSIAESIALLRPRGRTGDFDGDGRADMTVFRPSTGVWHTMRSTTGTPTALPWGNAADKPVVGDFDGDGRNDVAVFRPSNGTWYIVPSTTGIGYGVPWGNSADLPVPGDYDGDGKTDIAVFRPSNGTWYVVPSTTGVPYGLAWGNGADLPVPGDYDGDGKTDIAVFRPSTGTWYVVPSTTGVPYGYAWGNSADLPVPGDYDGDGRTDIAVFRPSNGTWYIVPSTTGVAYGYAWGNSADIPVPGDYDGDGKTDIAVFRSSNGTWYVVPSTTGVAYGFAWGNSADIPILKRP